MKTNLHYIILLFLPLSLFAQVIHTVDNRIGTTAQFSDAQTAVDAAAEGDFIYIHPSADTYGNITIRKTLHIRGLGHNPELNGGEHAILATISLNKDDTAGTNASNTTISGLEVNSIGMNLGSSYSNVHISNCLITNLLDIFNCNSALVDGNLFMNSSLRFNTAQTGNVIANNIFNWTNNTASFNMIQQMNDTSIFSNNVIVVTGTSNVFRNCNLPNVRNNLFLFADTTNTPTALLIEDSTINFQNCLTFGYGGQTIDVLNGVNNQDNVNPQLIDLGTPEDPSFSYDKNYAVASGSPAENAGSDGSDLGIFGAAFNFSMNGYPFDLPYPTSINIENPILQPGETLQVELTAEGN